MQKDSQYYEDKAFLKQERGKSLFAASQKCWYFIFFFQPKKTTRSWTATEVIPGKFSYPALQILKSAAGLTPCNAANPWVTQAVNPDLDLSITCCSTIDQSLNECWNDPASKACRAKDIKCSQAGAVQRTDKHIIQGWTDCWDVDIHIPHNTGFFLYQSTICCTILNSLNIKLFSHIHASVVQKSTLFYLVSHSFLFHFFFFFNLFLPIFSAFCLHYSAASWVMINTIMSLIFGCIKIHVVCSRENFFVNPIFTLGRSIHDARLGELLDRNIGTEIIWEFQGCW